MKLPSSKTFIVTIESEDGNAEFTFHEPKANEIYLKQKSEKKIVDDLLEVKGLYNENGEAVTVDEIKSYGPPVSFMSALFIAYEEALKALMVGPKKLQSKSA